LLLTAEFTRGSGDGKGGVGSRDIGPRYSKARAIAIDARDMLGGNGVLLGYQVAWHKADLEAIHTFEGTENHADADRRRRHHRDRRVRASVCWPQAWSTNRSGCGSAPGW